MAYWAAVVPTPAYAEQRLRHHETITVDNGAARPAPGDTVALVAVLAEPVVFGTGTVVSRRPCRIAYTHRRLDEPLAAAGLLPNRPVGLYPLDLAVLSEVVRRLAVGYPADRARWIVGVHLPIEASTSAEAVGEFWTYVMELGPRELPAYVHPLGDDLAMREYVAGEVIEDIDPH
jgi:hypothetical protein